MKSPTLRLCVAALALAMMAARPHASQWVFTLSGPCDYAVGFDTAMLVEEGHTAWKRATCPVSFTSLPSVYDYAGTVTLRWQVPASVCSLWARGNAGAIGTGRSGDLSRYYINGIPVCSTGTGSPYIAGSDEEGMCEIPAANFRPGRPNYLFAVYTAVRRTDYHGIWVAPIIGEARAVLRDYEMSIVTEFLMLGAFLAIALFFLILGILRRKDGHNLHFGLLSLSFFLFMSANANVKPLLYGGFPGLVRTVDVCSGILMTLFFVTFLVSFIAGRQNRTSIFFSAWLAFLAALSLLAVDTLTFAVRVAWYATAFMLVPIVGGFVYRHAVKGSVEAVIAGAGFAVFVASGLYDFCAFNGWVPFAFTMPYAFVVFIFAMTVLLARKFVMVHNRMEDLNAVLEKRVAERTAELAASNLQKDRILGAVAHDLKNPIGAIMTSTQLMERGGMPAGECVDLVKQACLQAMNTIGDLLAQARLGRDTGGGSAEPVDLVAFARSSFDLYRVRAREKGVALAFEEPRAPVPVRLNKSGFSRVIDNLLSNAIKFTAAEGTVTLRVEPGADRARLVVSDTGIGIPCDMKDSIFKRFTEASRTGTAFESSTGLGLSIAKEIVEKHGGRIWFDSEPGKGTAMYVEIPTVNPENGGAAR
jgi:signal transduction histidine kinase